MEFKTFKAPVAKQFERMAKHPLFRTGVDKDALWDGYLAAFPDGTNPIFRKRTEHDCNCCRNFIRDVGNVVAIIDGKVESIWDAEVADPAYQVVANALSALVKAQPIVNTFLHYAPSAGTDRTLIDAVDGVTSFSHFFVNIPKAFVKANAEIGAALGETRAHHDVLARSLDTITDDAIETVLDLIAQNALYRGEENKFAVTEFRKLKADYNRVPATGRDAFVWSRFATAPGSVSKIRNTSIGTLLTDLSEGKEIEQAVKAFEIMVAPANYKRPTALVTKAMIEKAKAAIAELGLGSALERRYATIADITVNNILFGNRDAKKAMGGDVFDDLASKVPAAAKSLDKVEDVHIDKFIADILPRATTIELLVENRHTSNLVSLVAPVDATAKPLFKWANHFSWSYNGDLADSIKERVKKAGGNVEGDLCCRLAWFNHDDLDFHMEEPGGHEIYFGNRLSKSPAGGRLDVDMNAGAGTTREPVENIFYANRSTMQEGTYHLFVHNFCQRETKDVGFEVEMDWLGEVKRFSYPQAARNRSQVTVVKFTYSKADGVQIVESLPSTGVSREVWGVATNTFVPVNVLMLSPNHWDDRAVGNKHWFFMLAGCHNDGQARGFFNEFLTEELTAHRKTLELVGSRMKTEESDRQLSGLGFSSTQRNSVKCRVKGAYSRVINLVF